MPLDVLLRLRQEAPRDGPPDRAACAIRNRQSGAGGNGYRVVEVGFDAVACAADDAFARRPGDKALTPAGEEDLGALALFNHAARTAVRHERRVLGLAVAAT